MYLIGLSNITSIVQNFKCNTIRIQFQYVAYLLIIFFQGVKYVLRAWLRETIDHFLLFVA